MLLTLALAAALLGVSPAPSATTAGSARAPGGTGAALDIPRLVLVSRGIPTGDARGRIPGLGPCARTLITGGKLEVRERDGRVHRLIEGSAPLDVSDPCVSWDGRRIVFAGTPARDSSWRLYIVGSDGRGLSELTHPGRADDFDPVWLPDGRVCFASTRDALESERPGVPASNLWVTDLRKGEPRRITADRNGAEEPVVDPANGRIVYSRAWSNRYRASDRDPSGVTTLDSLAIPGERVDLWQAVSITPDGDALRLAAGDPRERDAEMAYQCALSSDGRVYSVSDRDLTLAGAVQSPGIQWSHGVGAVFRVADAGTISCVVGAGAEAHGADAHAACVPRARACSPVVLPDGRVVFSRDPRGSGDFQLWIMDRDGRRLASLCDLPGTMELDAAVLAPRARPPRLRSILPPIALDRPPAGRETLDDEARNFRFDCLNVYANAAVDAPVADAPPWTPGARIRFFTVLARAGARDSLVLLREAPVGRGGSVHQSGLPGDVPMFEQIVAPDGRVLMSAHGPAHVAGFNFTRAGVGSKCVGCHAGHSIQPVPLNALTASWFNAAPGARVTASSTRARSAGARAAVDRRSRGRADSTAWIAASASGEWVRLDWSGALEIASVSLHGAPRPAAGGAGVTLGGCTLRFFLDGREVARREAGEVRPSRTTSVSCGAVTADALEVWPHDVRGTVDGKHAAALGEIETLARIAPSQQIAGHP
ncbi:MAG: PD40 domain-containing protein [Candidatus Eisenbacteria bacterium]|nr:PD40 domain-containing protein [Candidatus Eisenbacteria bacterium]